MQIRLKTQKKPDLLLFFAKAFVRLLIKICVFGNSPSSVVHRVSFKKMKNSGNTVLAYCSIIRSIFFFDIFQFLYGIPFFLYQIALSEEIFITMGLLSIC